MKTKPYQAGLIIALSACGQLQPDAELKFQSETTVTSDNNAAWKEYLRTQVKPYNDGYIYEGDLYADSLLEIHREFNSRHAQTDSALLVATVNNVDDIWPSPKRNNIRYCIHSSLGANQQQTASQFRQAADDWQSVANVTLIESTSDCDITVRAWGNPPVGAAAQAPFPHQTPGDMLLAPLAFLGGPSGITPLVGILRHEIGHSLGFRHENISPEILAICQGPEPWSDGALAARQVSPSLTNSVMFTPSGNNCATNLALTITQNDASGAAALYGSPTTSQCGSVFLQSPLEACCANGPACDSFILLGRELNACKPNLGGCYTSRSGSLVMVFAFLRDQATNSYNTWNDYPTASFPNATQLEILEYMAPFWSEGQPVPNGQYEAATAQLILEAQILFR